MSADLKFTVVTVTFNAEDVVRKTMDSVLNQSLSPYEYLIFDGASSDDTVKIAREYAPRFQEKGIRFRIQSFHHFRDQIRIRRHRILGHAHKDFRL